MRICHALLLSAALAVGSVPASSLAAELVIGVGSEATTMDPHFYNLGPNTETVSYTHLTLPTN